MLTDTVINNLTSYYGKANRDCVNTDVLTMRKAIYSAYLHGVSSDEKPLYAYCPEGEESWCFFQRALAKQEPPESHTVKKPLLAKIPMEKRKGILAIYEDLTRTDLLEKCLKGRTQNPNESYHSKIWSKCSKTKFASAARVRFCTQVTALDHIFGYEASHLLNTMAPTTRPAIKQLRTQDAARLSPKTHHRKTPKRTKLAEDYSPGGF